MNDENGRRSAFTLLASSAGRVLGLVLVGVLMVVWSGNIIGMIDRVLTSPVQDEGAIWAIIAFGIIGLVIMGRLAERALRWGRELPRRDALDPEREALRALAERGELTPAAVASATRLTADEAAHVLDGLAERGRVAADLLDGTRTYGLRRTDPRPPREQQPPAPEALPAPSASSAEPFQPPAGAPQPATETLVPPSPDEQAPEQSRTKSPAEPLSRREQEVLTLLETGRTNAEIAAQLYLTVGTVKTHTNNIYRKLGVRNRAEALARAHHLERSS